MKSLKHFFDTYVVIPLTISAIILWYIILWVAFIVLYIICSMAWLFNHVKRIYEGVIKC